MTIHTLHDLCYAYAVAEPVREMLFALQDRIDALEAQRRPLTDGEFAYVWHQETRRIMGTDKALLLRAKQITEAAHGIKEGT